jgi:hypothetical protein
MVVPLVHSRREEILGSCPNTQEQLRIPSLLGCKDVLLFFARCGFGTKAGCRGRGLKPAQGVSAFPVRSRERGVRNPFEHSVELVDSRGRDRGRFGGC